MKPGVTSSEVVTRTWTVAGDQWIDPRAGELTVTAEAGGGQLRISGTIDPPDLSLLYGVLREAEEFAGIRQSARQLGPTVRTHCA